MDLFNINTTNLINQLSTNNEAKWKSDLLTAYPILNTTPTLPNDVRLYIIGVVETYNPCMTQYSEMKSFFSNTANTQCTYDAYTTYGLPPLNKFNQCIWQQGMYSFYLAAKLFKLYPAFDISDSRNCRKIKEVQDGLEVTKLNADKQFVADQDNNLHSYQTQVINDLQNKLNAAYTNLSCSYTVSTQTQAQTLDAITQATTDSEAATTNSSTNKIFYVIAVIIIIVILIKIFKH